MGTEVSDMDIQYAYDVMELRAEKAERERDEARAKVKASYANRTVELEKLEKAERELTEARVRLAEEQVALEELGLEWAAHDKTIERVKALLPAIRESMYGQDDVADELEAALKLDND